MINSPLAKHFATWGKNLELTDIPLDVRMMARKAVIDTLGVMAAGTAHSLTQTLSAKFNIACGICSVFGSHNGDAETAALINGCAAHVWDFDDTSYTGIMHGSAVILPVVLALAEETGASEDSFISAFVAGSEIAYCLADICTHDHYFDGWWSTITFGLVGATAAASYLLGLTEDQTINAISLAASSASGGKVVFGSDAKPYLVGDTARRAINFARTAMAGVTGPVNAFEDQRGFFALLNNKKSVMPEANTLGQRWRLVSPGLLFKTSPVCSAAHAAIDQMSQIMKESDAKFDDIISIKAEVPKLVDVSLVFPYPKTIQQAQFSLPYALACTAINGRVLLSDIRAEEINSTQKEKLMAKITTIAADDLSTDEMRNRYPESARLTVTLPGGHTFRGFCGEAYGMPNNPLSSADLTKKLFSCLEFAGIKAPKQFCLEANLLNLASLINDAAIN